MSFESTQSATQSISSTDSNALTIPIPKYSPDIDHSDFVLSDEYRHGRRKSRDSAWPGLASLDNIDKIFLKDGIRALESIMGDFSTREECFSATNQMGQIIFFIARQRSIKLCCGRREERWRLSGSDGSLVIETRVLVNSQYGRCDVHYFSQEHCYFIPMGVANWNMNRYDRLHFTSLCRANTLAARDPEEMHPEDYTALAVGLSKHTFKMFSGSIERELKEEEEMSTIQARMLQRADFRGTSSACAYLDLNLQGSLLREEKAILIVIAALLRSEKFFRI